MAHTNNNWNWFKPSKDETTKTAPSLNRVRASDLSIDM